MNAMCAEENFIHIQSLLNSEGKRRGLKSVMGVASFTAVYESLMPVQKMKLSEISLEMFERLMRDGSIISIAYAYPEYAIEAIGWGSEKAWDKDKWNIYSKAYTRLNKALNETAGIIAEAVKGIAIPATVEGLSSKINHVEDYYAQRVSHRVAAEKSGIGWKGKNELIVNPRYSCAIRLASILTRTTVTRTPPIANGCGECRACLQACKFLDHKNQLENYREQCRRYLVHLNLEDEVCGKCIKSCYKNSLYSKHFKLM
jgi:epoxyqueuosine reductase